MKPANGILVVDKPAGWTSHDVVAKLRGIYGTKRIGHGGTLDPMATGVLPVFIGRATRAAEFCENAEKEYIAGLKPGVVTDTQDITGNIISDNTDMKITSDDIQAVLPRFTGAQKQIPPMYSAVKRDGRKLYELARRGIEVPREPRDIVISVLELLPAGRFNDGLFTAGSDEFTLRIVCSKGTYIRTLCNDIGEALGCGAVMSALRRTRAGVFTLDSSYCMRGRGTVPPPRGAEEPSPCPALPPLLSVDTLFNKHPAITIDDESVRKVKNGMQLNIKNTEPGRYRVYAPDGEFLLLGEVKSGILKTIKSFYEVDR